MSVNGLLNNVRGISNLPAGAAASLGRLESGSYWSQLRPASYRGVPFGVLGGSASFGRRNAVHEYPFRDTPWVEDLGMSARHVHVTGFLVGDDVIAQRTKLIQWSPALRAAVTEALALQRTTSMYVFGNTGGQVYTRSGWNTIWTRLMKYCEAQATKEGVEFTRFTLADMRPTAVTDRMTEGDAQIIDATGHSDGRMVAKVYDRRRIKTAKATK